MLEYILTCSLAAREESSSLSLNGIYIKQAESIHHYEFQEQRPKT